MTRACLPTAVLCIAASAAAQTKDWTQERTPGGDVRSLWSPGGEEAFAATSTGLWRRAPDGSWSVLGATPLTAVYGTTASDVWAVGPARSGSRSGTVLHWDGGALTDRSADTPPLHLLGSVAAVPGSQWFGGSGAIVTKDGEDWASWSITAPPSASPSTGYSPVVAFSDKDLWAIAGREWCTGRALTTCYIYSDIIHWNGTVWTTSLAGPVVFDNNASLQSLIPAGAFLVAGGNGQFELWDGVRWNDLRLPKTVEVPRMWAASSADVWLVYETFARGHWDTFVGAQLGHFDGNSISLESLPVSPRATAIAGSESRLWIAGPGGVIVSRSR